MIESLPVGKYTLREKSALYGYKAASDVTFEVKETAEIQKVSITWKYAHIFFSRYFDLYLTTTAIPPQAAASNTIQTNGLLSSPVFGAFVAVVFSVVAVAVAVAVAAPELLFPPSVVASVVVSVVVPPVARLISKSALHSPSV